MEQQKAPCKNCKKRKIINNVSCHSKCKVYKDWARNFYKEKKDQAELEKLNNASYSMFDSMQIRKPLKGGKV